MGESKTERLTDAELAMMADYPPGHICARMAAELFYHEENGQEHEWSCKVVLRVTMEPVS